MRSSRRLQRCHPGRNVRMPLKVEGTTVGLTGAAEGATIAFHTVAVEAMKEVVEGDMKTGGAEESVAEEGRCREAGERELEGEEVGTARVTTKMQEIIMGEAGEEVIREGEPTKEDSRIRAFTGEEEATPTVIARTGAGTRKEAAAVEAEGAGAEAAEEVKVEAGGVEEVRISTKEDSLNSFSNMEGSSTTRLASIKADTTPAEGAMRGFTSEIRTLNSGTSEKSLI